MNQDPAVARPALIIPALAEEVAAKFGVSSGVVAVALGGSRVTGLADERSDVDLYVYAQQPIPVPVREAIVGPLNSQRELDLRFWEPGDVWVDTASGLTVDVMYRAPAWIERETERVVVRHEASVGYSTCLWHNVRTSASLIDPTGWFAALQNLAARPYPEPLRRAIIAKNHPILRRSMTSFLHQIERSLDRGDTVAVQHRSAALLASYSDVLFALNRQTHPGEKRLLPQALTLCPLRPVHLERQVAAVLAAPLLDEKHQVVSVVHQLIDGLEDQLIAEGLI